MLFLEDFALEAGDVISAIDGTTVKRGLDFERSLLDRRPEERLTFNALPSLKCLDCELPLAAIDRSHGGAVPA